MTKLFLSFAVVALSLGTANAALVNIATNTLASPVRLVTTSGGNPLPLGSVIRIGTFPTGVGSITSTTTFATLNSRFVPIGENAGSNTDGTNGPIVSTTTAAAGGGWAGTINSVDNAAPQFAAATRLYIMVLDAAPESMSGATNLLILSDPSWTIPSSGTRAMTSAQVSDQTEVFYGTWGASSLQMGAFNVPEASTSLMALLAGMGLIARRRR